MISHEFSDGKYVVTFDDDSRLSATRYGETWRELTGDGLVLAMLQEVDRLATLVKEVVGVRCNKWHSVGQDNCLRSKGHDGCHGNSSMEWDE